MYGLRSVRSFAGLAAALLPVLALTVRPAPAQSLTGEVRAATPYGVWAAQGTQSDFESWPANTLVPSGQSSIDANIDNVSVATLVGWQVGGGSVSCDVSEQGVASATSAPALGGTTPSPTATGVQQGPHALRFRVLGAPGTRGKLQVWATGLADPGASVTMAADVNDDNSTDFQLVTVPGVGVFDRRQWDVRLDANGALVVRVVTEAQVVLATGSTRWKTGISVVFTPGHFCDVGGYGQSCGPRITGSDDVVAGARQLTLQLTDAPPSANGVLVVGTQQLSVPLPLGSCLLQADPVVVLPFAADMYGMASHALRAPLGLPFSVTFQDVLVAPGPALTSSNGVATVCR